MTILPSDPNEVLVEPSEVTPEAETQTEATLREEDEVPVEETSEVEATIETPVTIAYASRANFLQSAIDYFAQLQEQQDNKVADPYSLPEENPEIITEEGFRFDLHSLRQANFLAQELQDHLVNQLNEQQFQTLQTVYTFYKTPEQFLDKLKLMFMGNWEVKEKIVRIYGAKVIGTYKVTKIILDTIDLFSQLPEAEAQTIKDELRRHAEEPLKKFKNLLPRSIQEQIPWRRDMLAQNIQQVLAITTPWFQAGHNYELITTRFREFIFWLYGNPLILTYLQWKGKYLRYWMYTELHRLDIKNMLVNNVKIPQYTLIKIKVYQQLESFFGTLDGKDQLFDRTKNLKKSHYTALNQGEAFLPDAPEVSHSALRKAREAEAELLDSLSPAQIEALAERLHGEISQIRRKNELKGEVSPASGVRASDLGSETKAEQRYSTATLKIQVEAAQVSPNAQPKKFWQKLQQIASRWNWLPPKKDTPTEPAPKTEPLIPPRAEGSTGEPLEPVAVDWFGFGREFKSTVYDPKIPNLQQNYFNYGALKLYLHDDFKKLMEAVFAYYGDFGYVQKMVHKVGVTVDGRSSVKDYEDQALYLRLSETSFIALGKSPFSKSSPPVFYFQLYSSQPNNAYSGPTKNIDFSRMVDGVKYDLENFEVSTVLRPAIFRSLLQVIDSFPDELRAQHVDFLKGIYKFFEANSPSQADRRSLGKV